MGEIVSRDDWVQILQWRDSPPPPWKVINYIACGNYKVERIKEDKMCWILKDCCHLRSADGTEDSHGKENRVRFRGE